MKETRVAIRYAKALFELCQEQGIVDAVSSDMKMLAGTIKVSNEFKRFLGSPIISDRKKKSILTNIFSGKVHKLTLDFIRLMVENNRESVIGAVASEFHGLYKQLNGIVSAELTTTGVLIPELRDEIVKAIEHEMKASVELSEKTDESLIGGFILEIEDKQFDASILHKIQNLSREFELNTYEKGF